MPVALKPIFGRVSTQEHGYEALGLSAGVLAASPVYPEARLTPLHPPPLAGAPAEFAGRA